MKSFKQFIFERVRKNPKEEALRLKFRKDRTERRILHGSNALAFVNTSIQQGFAKGKLAHPTVYGLKQELQTAIPKLKAQSSRLSATLTKYK